MLSIKETGNQPRGVPGPTPLAPTDKERQLVAALCKRGVPYEQIAAQIRGGISRKTLERRFKPELRSAKVGKKPFAPTEAERKLVKSLAVNGIRYCDIAALVREGISIPTLTKYFKPELQHGTAEANAKIGETLFQQAIGGNTAALIWWTKARMGWRAAWDGPKDRHPECDRDRLRSKGLNGWLCLRQTFSWTKAQAQGCQGSKAEVSVKGSVLGGTQEGAPHSGTV